MVLGDEMVRGNEEATLRNFGINASAQRVAVARYVLHTSEHPCADEVWRRVRQDFPQVSRATIYNTLNLFAEKGLLRPFSLDEGRIVFDPNVDDHHHFIDDETAVVYDIPRDAISVEKLSELDGFEVRDYEVVLRGEKTRKKRST